MSKESHIVMDIVFSLDTICVCVLNVLLLFNWSQNNEKIVTFGGI